MTKKEITTLLILFGGGWLLVLSLISTLNALPHITALITSGFRDDWGYILLLTGTALLPILCYGSLGCLLIRRSNLLAERLLDWGKIDGAAIIQGGDVSGLLPLLFSMLGLYFLVTNLPYFLLTAYRWFVLEASSHASTRYLGSDIGMQIAGYKADLTMYGLTLSLAVFVLLRSAWIAGRVQKFSQREARDRA